MQKNKMPKLLTAIEINMRKSIGKRYDEEREKLITEIRYNPIYTSTDKVLKLYDEIEKEGHISDLWHIIAGNDYIEPSILDKMLANEQLPPLIAIGLLSRDGLTEAQMQKVLELADKGPLGTVNNYIETLLNNGIENQTFPISQSFINYIISSGQSYGGQELAYCKDEKYIEKLLNEGVATEEQQTAIANSLLMPPHIRERAFNEANWNKICYTNLTRKMYAEMYSSVMEAMEENEKHELPHIARVHLAYAITAMWSSFQLDFLNRAKEMDVPWKTIQSAVMELCKKTLSTDVIRVLATQYDVLPLLSKNPRIPEDIKQKYVQYMIKNNPPVIRNGDVLSTNCPDVEFTSTAKLTHKQCQTLLQYSGTPMCLVMRNINTPSETLAEISADYNKYGRFACMAEMRVAIKQSGFDANYENVIMGIRNLDAEDNSYLAKYATTYSAMFGDKERYHTFINIIKSIATKKEMPEDVRQEATEWVQKIEKAQAFYINHMHRQGLFTMTPSEHLIMSQVENARLLSLDDIRKEAMLMELDALKQYSENLIEHCKTHLLNKKSTLPYITLQFYLAIEGYAHIYDVIAEVIQEKETQKSLEPVEKEETRCR